MQASAASRIRFAISPSISVGNAPSPTRVEYALTTPITSSILVGPTPKPVVTAPADGFEEVTYG